MASDKTSLGDRMKEYEKVSRHSLIKRMPVMIRIDGRAFHTFTRGFQKPFDPVLCNAMKDTMAYLCDNIQNCVLGYTQSDEITLVLVDYADINTDVWFGNGIQKMASVSASMATMFFNKRFEMYNNDSILNGAGGVVSSIEDGVVSSYFNKRERAISKGACFDARVFNVPVDEVTNAVLWRQEDAIRNSKSSLAQHYFSAKELHKKTANEMVAMVKEKTGIAWDELPIWMQRGSACIKKNGTWVIDDEMPILKGEGRNYVEQLIQF